MLQTTNLEIVKYCQNSLASNFQTTWLPIEARNLSLKLNLLVYLHVGYYTL